MSEHESKKLVEYCKNNDLEIETNIDGEYVVFEFTTHSNKYCIEIMKKTYISLKNRNELAEYIIRTINGMMNKQMEND